MVSHQPGRNKLNVAAPGAGAPGRGNRTSIRSTRNSMGAMIEVRDLVKNFGEFCAVNHVSFAVPEGEIFGFLGPNGAGKTTTIKMLTTVLNPTSGFIRVNGCDPQREQRKVRRSFGIVFQDPS